jgi:hypothetical protein
MSAQPSPDSPRPFIPWGRQAAPVFPDETLLCMRAQSALSGPELGQCPPLTVEQARDVLAWYDPKH